MKFSLISLFAILSVASGFSVENSRRAFIGGAAAVVGASLVPGAANAALGAIAKDSVVQREMNSFISLIQEFKDVTLNGGLDASKLNEPSVSFLEFGERMKKGEVASVEFLAPSGDVAYVKFKPKDGEKGSSEKIRIGQGYPTESKDSWTSPAYVIRAVSNFGVPYTFTVPALAKYKQ